MAVSTARGTAIISDHSSQSDLQIVMSWQQDYLNRFYFHSTGWTDGTTDFHQLCASVIPPDCDILEIGAGPSNATSRFLRSIGKVHGVDIDPDVLTNDALDSAHLLVSDTYPFPDNTFDACVSNYVIEHIASPKTHLKEVLRVLKTNGVYVFRTPSKFHYTTVVSRLTPHWFHKLVANRLRNLPHESHEPYPTLYKLNTKAKIQEYAAKLNFTVEELRLIEKEPSYGLSSRLLFITFMLYERAVNKFEALANLRSNIIGVLRNG